MRREAHRTETSTDYENSVKLWMVATLGDDGRKKDVRRTDTSEYMYFLPAYLAPTAYFHHLATSLSMRRRVSMKRSNLQRVSDGMRTVT